MENLTTSEKINLGTKEITKRIRQQIRKKYPEFKFSVTKESYSMGSSIHVHLMESPIKIIKRSKDLTEEEIYNFYWLNQHYGSVEAAKEILFKRHEGGNFQISYNSFFREYEDRNCNHTVLTKEGFEILKEVVKIVMPYHYDKGDPMTDYSNTNFYFHLYLGKWDKPFIQP